MRAMFLSLGVVALAGCGQKVSEDRFVELPVQVAQAPSAALHLVGADAEVGSEIVDFRISVTGCRSGYATTVASSSTSPVNRVALHKGDVGCLAGLVEFTFGGRVFAKKGGGALTAGSGVFETHDRQFQLDVGVVEQFDSPLTSSGGARFQFFEIRAGAEHNPSPRKYSEPHDLRMTGVGAPNLEIADMELVGWTAASEPSYRIGFECQTALVARACPSAGGEPQSFADMDVKVVKDTFGGQLTHAQATSLFATSGVLGGEDLSIGTRGGMRVTVSGPAPLYPDNREMLVVIRYRGANGASFRYFDVNIGDPAL